MSPEIQILVCRCILNEIIGEPSSSLWPSRKEWLVILGFNCRPATRMSAPFPKICFQPYMMDTRHSLDPQYGPVACSIEVFCLMV